MGLLDALLSGGGNSLGLFGGNPYIDPSVAAQQQQGIGNSIPAMPPPVITANAQAPQQVPQQAPQLFPQGAPSASVAPSFLQSQGSGGGLGGVFRGALANANGGPLGMLFGGIAGGMGMGQGNPQDIARQNLTAQYQALLPDLGPQKAMLAVLNPEAAKPILEQQYGPSKNSVVKIGQDAFGREQYGILNQSDGTVKPLGAQSGDSSGTPTAGNPKLTGQDYLASLPQEMQGTVKGMVEGRIAPPTSFAMSKPYWQSMIAAAQQVDPNFDQNTWTARHKMTTDLGSSTPNSIGGIISNGKSAFEHLANASDKLVDLGNYNGPNIPGGGPIAQAGNYIGNTLLPNSATQGKIQAAKDNLLKYGQEATKFYAGSGGGEAERMMALKSQDPASASGNEQAGFLQTEKELMLGRLKQKEGQINDIMGPEWLARHPVMTPQLQTTLDKIDANIAKLRGQGGTPAASAPAIPPGWKVQVH